MILWHLADGVAILVVRAPDVDRVVVLVETALEFMV